MFINYTLTAINYTKDNTTYLFFDKFSGEAKNCLRKLFFKTKITYGLINYKHLNKNNYPKLNKICLIKFGVYNVIIVVDTCFCFCYYLDTCYHLNALLERKQ